VPDLTPEEHRRRGEAADPLFRRAGMSLDDPPDGGQNAQADDKPFCQT